MSEILTHTFIIMERILKRSPGIFTILLVIIDLCYVCGTTVTLPSDKVAILGANELIIQCDFNVDVGINQGITLRRKRSVDSSFVDIAGFTLPDVAYYEDSSLQTRTDLTLQANIATMKFNIIECNDAAEYQCSVKVIVNGAATDFSDQMLVKVEVLPTSPRLTPDMTNPNDRIKEEHSILSFQCQGDVGNPAGNFFWFGYRESEVIDLTLQAQKNQPIQQSCNFFRVSQLTINLTRIDNQIAIRCAVNQSTLGLPPTSGDICQNNSCIQTNRITVQYPIRQEDVVVNTSPSDNHVVGSRVTLKCDVDGNPAPNYMWSKNGDENITMDKPDWIINSLQLGDGGLYECFITNTVNGVTYNASKTLNLNVVETPAVITTSPSPPTSPSSETGRTEAIKPTDPGDGNKTTIIIAVCVVILVLLIVVGVVAFVIIRRRRKKAEVEEPPEKPYNNHNFNMYNTKPDLVTGDEKKQNFYNKSDDGLTYADLKFDDKPRSRRPVALADNMTDYADIAMPHV